MKLMAVLPAVPTKAAVTVASLEPVPDGVRIASAGATGTWNVLLSGSPCKRVSSSVSLEPDTQAHVCSHTRTCTHVLTCVVPLDTTERKGSTHTGSVHLQLIFKDAGGRGVWGGENNQKLPGVLKPFICLHIL